MPTVSIKWFNSNGGVIIVPYTMDLYDTFQPVSWHVGIIEASLDAVRAVIQPLYVPSGVLKGVRNETETIDEALASLEPLGPLHGKILLMKTQDSRTTLFTNALVDAVSLPTWHTASKLNVSAYYVCNVPHTISKDQRSGAYGWRKLEFRTPETPFNKEPRFGIHLINDAGRWCFYRFGEHLPFEKETAYKSLRKTERFTSDMLLEYCKQLNICVYDRTWYGHDVIIIERYLRQCERGMTYSEARRVLRIHEAK